MLPAAACRTRVAPLTRLSVVVMMAMAMAMAMAVAAQAETRHMPDDPLFATQWTLFDRHPAGDYGSADVPRERQRAIDIDAPAAWAVTPGSPAIVIAILDDGVDSGHPDLAPNLSAHGMDFSDLPPQPGGHPRGPADNHGTAVAAVAAARGDNGYGISGACPRCTILPVRVNRASATATAAGFRYATDAGADIIVVSWGYSLGDTIDDPVPEAIEYAARTGRDGLGALIVVAMTNRAVDNCVGPDRDLAALDAVVAVGVADHEARIGGSGFGACMDLVAPSKPRYRSTRGVLTADRPGFDGYSQDAFHRRFGGTSAAAPLVAGVAGLVLAVNPALPARAVQAMLETTADKIDPSNAHYDERGFSELAGWGRVNAGRAVALAMRNLSSKDPMPEGTTPVREPGR